jgi:anti-anti-sigma factor
MEIKENRVGAALVISFSGRLDATTSGQLEKLLVERLQSGVNRLVLDMSDLQYISSAGLRVLGMTLKQLSATEGRMALCGVRETVQKVFDISGFTPLFRIATSLDDAVASIS